MLGLIDFNRIRGGNFVKDNILTYNSAFGAVRL